MDYITINYIHRRIEMLDNIKAAFIPYLVGLGLISFGWYMTINATIKNIAIAKAPQSSIVFTGETGFGFVLILLGAYLPGLYLWIRGKMSK